MKLKELFFKSKNKQDSMTQKEKDKDYNKCQEGFVELKSIKVKLLF